jgi:hypothetical protein
MPADALDHYTGLCIKDNATGAFYRIGIGYFTGGGSSNLSPHEKRAAALSNRFCGVTADGYVHLLAHQGFPKDRVKKPAHVVFTSSVEQSNMTSPSRA